MSAEINLSDGHARQDLTASQQRIVHQLSDLFMQAVDESPTLLEEKAQAAFLAAVGQHSAISEAEVLSCYSSSVAMEIFARSLQAEGLRRVALIHPTFDNIPDILRGLGMELLPVDEGALTDGSASIPDGAEVLFITTPNNPTGRVLPPDVLTHWARVCAARGIILALDTSFRGFDERAQYDHYAILAREECRYVVMEDTGKLWPTLDLKAGLLAFPHAERLPLRRIHSDILLGVSPLILLMVQRFAEDAVGGGFTDLHSFIAANRSLLRGTLAGVPGVSFPDTDSRSSVERVLLPAGQAGGDVWQDLVLRDVHVLPCRQFFWADPAAGEPFIRVALSRPRRVVAAAASAMREYLNGG